MANKASKTLNQSLGIYEINKKDKIIASDMFLLDINYLIANIKVTELAKAMDFCLSSTRRAFFVLWVA